MRVVIIFAFVDNCWGDTTLEEADDKAYSFAYISATAVKAPVNRFLILRENNSLCAIKFISFHRGHDAKPASLFHTGMESLFGEYKWYYSNTSDDRFIESESGQEMGVG